ncbi:hypothetical protein D043_2818A, partial [Vibrio parahaemolyticus EKP-021]
MFASLNSQFICF